jgi:phosphoribosylanthranilate isomerase
MTIRIKFCGVTTPDDALAAVDAGADFVGLNFSAHSVRRVTLDQARAIVEALPRFDRFTGVYVEQSWEEIAAVNRAVKLMHCQTYATPWPEERFTPAGQIAAFRVRSAEDIEAIHALLAASPRKPMAVLVDSFVIGAMGGTGHTAPWELLAGQDFGVPLILAGGLTPENVGDAIRLVKPWGVDVASGIESVPGRKDAGKMRAFVSAVRDAERAL